MRPLLCGIALLLPVSAAWGHALLDRASPPVGSTVAASPEAVTLRFSEAIEPLFSSVHVTNAKGQAVEAAAPSTQQNGRVLVIRLKALPPGTYTVDWHVTSVDTHKTQGHFDFTVAP